MPTAALRLAAVNGRLCKRCPVASAMALAIVAVAGHCPASPAPRNGRPGSLPTSGRCRSLDRAWCWSNRSCRTASVSAVRQRRPGHPAPCGSCYSRREQRDLRLFAQAPDLSGLVARIDRRNLRRPNEGHGYGAECDQRYDYTSRDRRRTFHRAMRPNYSPHVGRRGSVCTSYAEPIGGEAPSLKYEEIFARDLLSRRSCGVLIRGSSSTPRKTSIGRPSATRKSRRQGSTTMSPQFVGSMRERPRAKSGFVAPSAPAYLRSTALGGPRSAVPPRDDHIQC